MSDIQQGASLRRDVAFDVRGVTVRGRLRLPEGDGPHPVVVLAHGLGGLKEWTIPEIADILAADGIAALAIDYRNFGDSDGEPREEVDHCGQIDDFHGAISYATTVPELDGERIGVWGTSLGGRNALAVAALDPRVRCVVVQVPAVATSTELWAELMTEGDVDAAKQVLVADRNSRAMGGEPQYVEFPNDPNTDYGSYWATFGEAEKRNWTPRVSLQSFWPTMADDVMALMPKIAPRPLLMIIADEEHPVLLASQRAAYEAAGEPKSLLVGHGHHYSVYTTWKDEAIGAAREWFAEYLGAS